MFKGLKPILMLFLFALVFGCASKKEDQSSRYQALDIKNQNVADEKRNAEVARQLVKNAHKAIGAPYVRGGSNPGGFDCSGFVMWAYDRVGVKLPRTAREQAVVGEKIQNQDEMRAGDIVAFRHPKRGYHTGIYLGDGKFIHSPRKRSRVKISSLEDAYFRSTLLGARRVKFDCSDTLLVQAGSQPENYMEERGLEEKSVSPAKSRVKKSVKKSKISSKAKKDKVRAVASKKSAKKSSIKAVASKKNSKSASIKKSNVKKNVKSVAHNAKRSKIATTAKNSVKKNSSKTVSMLHKKSR